MVSLLMVCGGFAVLWFFTFNMFHKSLRWFAVACGNLQQFEAVFALT